MLAFLVFMTACYILYSEKLNRFYIGALQSNIEARIEKHNNGYYGNHRFTAKATDWRLYLLIEVETYSHALAIEKYIKSMKSSVYIKNLHQYPEMIEALKLKTTKST